MRQRINALVSIGQYVSKIDSKKVYLEQTMYLHLEEIFKRATGAPWVYKNAPSNPTTVYNTS